ncbi:sensor histidine kinase [Singulisphaera acidiphila]|uniref:histidine kinase n=1 Tax=Singulisphaera acidiphila (strain ATCC BAA-1392 / DSM 18658 / VKM B-2454 / MOB10) TaxID=886293 RepID=L0DLL3_SINAD|nr:ATP-binding protein [Singulisphaera acidiphila]AGA29556.1 signal transduction histidine kinase [Singulisphaera acidiphila DSM 18658]
MVLVCVVLAIALAIVTFILLRSRRTLAKLERGVAALGNGRPTRPIATSYSCLAGPLAHLFNIVAPKLEARIALQEQDRQQLRAVLGGMSEGVIAIDARRRLLFANASANQLFGIDADSVGRLIPELIRSTQVQGAVEATLSSPNPYQGEVTLATRESVLRIHSRILAVYGTPLPGPPPGAVLVFHDVTELRRLERMRQDFVANASHELKTPLASIKAYTETLLDWALKDETVNVRFLERIDEQAERLNQLILDMLSLARLETGQEVFEHGPLPLAPVIVACLNSHRDRADAKGLQLSLELGELDEQSEVKADEEAIRQILDNLVDNAIKYTHEGGSVRVSCRQTDDAIAVEVADSGIGIPRDELARVFERFYRVDKARSRELGGTGLGLSIVKHLVQSIDGQVTVVSRLGAGSCFTVRLPRFRPLDARI